MLEKGWENDKKREVTMRLKAFEKNDRRLTPCATADALKIERDMKVESRAISCRVI